MGSGVYYYSLSESDSSDSSSEAGSESGDKGGSSSDGLEFHIRKTKSRLRTLQARLRKRQKPRKPQKPKRLKEKTVYISSSDDECGWSLFDDDDHDVYKDKRNGRSLSDKDSPESEDDDQGESYYDDPVNEKLKKKFMHQAAFGDSKSVLIDLNNEPARMRWKDSASGNTVLHVAAERGNSFLVEDLVRFVNKIREKEGRKLISLKQPNKEGDTALHLALRKRNWMVASYLIRKKPKAAYKLNYAGVSPLYLAVKAGRMELVRLLFQELPGSLVPQWRSEKLLLAGHASVVHAAIKRRNIETLQLLLDHLPILVKSTNKKGWKPLSFAAYRGDVEAVSYLLENFPESATFKDDDGCFPIHKAVRAGHISVLNKFLSHCPEEVILLKNKKRQTLLHLAANKRRIIEYLEKEHNHKIQIIAAMRDKDGKTYKDLIGSSSS